MYIHANGIKIACEVHGVEDGVPVVLIRGLGSQMVHWPDELVAGFVDEGYRVIIFDNRDVGLSERVPGIDVDASRDAILDAVNSGEPVNPAYALTDMAHDVTGLMDALDIKKAHIFGISLGGAIAQVLAIDHADRLLSACFVMTSARAITRERLPKLLVEPQTRKQFQDAWVAGNAEWGSPGFPASEHYLREQAGRAYDNGYDPEGINRQALAGFTTPDKTAALQKLQLPVLVIHGQNDTLIPATEGRHLASLIPNAKLELIDGMGHVITPTLAPVIVEKLHRAVAAKW